MQRAGVLKLLPVVSSAKPGPLPRAAERALASLAALNVFIIKPGAESSLLECIEGKAARTAVFPFEALMRNAAKRFGGDFEKHEGRVKNLEDGLGHHIDAIERLAEMRKLGRADLINYWAGRQTEQRELLTHVLHKRWLPHLAGDKAEVPRLVKDLRAAKWGDPAADREANLGGLHQEAMRVVTEELDMKDPDQVHRLRRSCRWYALDARALSGHIVLVDGGEPAEFTHYLTSPAADLEFASLPPAKAEANAIALSKALWIGSTHIIEELAKLKAKGETFLAVREALVKGNGMKPEKAEGEAMRIMKWTKKERAAETRAAEELQAEAVKVFGAIAEQMAAQMARPPEK
jgi:hypothetical protein